MGCAIQTWLLEREYRSLANQQALRCVVNTDCIRNHQRNCFARISSHSPPSSTFLSLVASRSVWCCRDGLCKAARKRCCGEGSICEGAQARILDMRGHAVFLREVVLLFAALRRALVRCCAYLWLTTSGRPRRRPAARGLQSFRMRLFDSSSLSLQQEAAHTESCNTSAL